MIGNCLENVRKNVPLVHNITNYVTVNDVANVLLACGGSPIMSDEPDDVADITSICGGLNINIGTFNKNSIEGMFIAGTTKGVDADVSDAVTEENLDNAVAFVKDYAKKSGCVIAITGAIDLVSDGEKCYVIRNGRPEMSKITGTGCQLSGMTTAFIVANPDNVLEATAAAVCTMGLAGEIAFANMAETDGNSTYRNRIIDAIYNMDAETLEKGAKYELR